MNKEFSYTLLKWFKERGYEVHVAANGTSEIDCDSFFDVPFERSPFKRSNILVNANLLSCYCKQV